MLLCPDCGGRLRVLACVTEVAEVKRYLEHVGIDATGPPVARARSGEGPSRAELDSIVRGLRLRVAEDVVAEKEAKHALQRKLVAVIRESMERAGGVYLQASYTVADLHTRLAGANEFLKAAGEGEDPLFAGDWADLFIPGAQGLAALKGKGMLRNPVWNSYVLAGGDAAMTHARGNAAHTLLSSVIATSLGMPVPFGPPTPALIPVPRGPSGVRAALEAKADALGMAE